MEIRNVVKVKELKVGTVYNYFKTLIPRFDFTVVSTKEDVVYITGVALTGIEGVLLLTDEDSYYFVRELTELEKVLL